MKRKRLENTFQQQKIVKSDHIPPSILTKRKFEQDDVMGKRHRVEDTQEVDDLRRRNFELEQMVHALVAKVQTLEYMIQMFRRNETIHSNNLITAY